MDELYYCINCGEDMVEEDRSDDIYICNNCGCMFELKKVRGKVKLFHTDPEVEY